jgi:hypothetical protein
MARGYGGLRSRPLCWRDSEQARSRCQSAEPVGSYSWRFVVERTYPERRRPGDLRKWHANCEMYWRYGRCVCGERLRTCMSSIMRWRSAVIDSSSTGRSTRHCATPWSCNRGCQKEMLCRRGSRPAAASRLHQCSRVFRKNSFSPSMIIVDKTRRNRRLKTARLVAFHALTH